MYDQKLQVVENRMHATILFGTVTSDCGLIQAR